jgi:hypothetical protein
MKQDTGMCDCMKAPLIPRNVRLLINGGDNMLGRAVQLTLRHQSPREEFIQDSMYAIHYLVKGTSYVPSVTLRCPWRES